MNPTAPSNSKQKVIASFIIVFAIVIIAIAVSTFTKKEAPVNNQTASEITQTTDTEQADTTESVQKDATSTYKDGTYTAASDYSTPGGSEGVTVTLTIQNDAVTESSLSFTTNDREARQYQQSFNSGYKTLVVGKDIDEIKLSRVSGSSLTSGGFNAAIEQIKSEAKK